MNNTSCHPREREDLFSWETMDSRLRGNDSINLRNRNSLGQLFVRPVAKRFRPSVFTTAQPNLFVFLQGELRGCEFAALVGAIAERLVVRLAARTPPVVAGLEVFAVGRFLRDDRVHGYVPC